MTKPKPRKKKKSAHELRVEHLLEQILKWVSRIRAR